MTNPSNERWINETTKILTHEVHNSFQNNQSTQPTWPQSNDFILSWTSSIMILITILMCGGCRHSTSKTIQTNWTTSWTNPRVNQSTKCSSLNQKHHFDISTTAPIMTIDNETLSRRMNHNTTSSFYNQLLNNMKRFETESNHIVIEIKTTQRHKS